MGGRVHTITDQASNTSSGWGVYTITDGGAYTTDSCVLTITDYVGVYTNRLVGREHNRLAGQMHSTESDVTQDFPNKFPGTLIKVKNHNTVELELFPKSLRAVADMMDYLQCAEDNKLIGYFISCVFISFAEEQADSYQDDSTTRSSNTESKRGSFTDSDSASSNEYTANPKKDDRFLFTNPVFQDDDGVILSHGAAFNQNIRIYFMFSYMMLYKLINAKKKKYNKHISFCAIYVTGDHVILYILHVRFYMQSK
ncbi:hypothetical protein Btru_068801 [Bulinus truncatus]|nr:hypothetical protein Btru_068801 [Bulinus truncatus]